MIYLKLILLILLPILNALRGYGKIPFLRRPQCIAIMSVSMGLYLAWVCKVWWLFFLCGGLMAGLLSTGDSNRPLWCFLVALGASLGLVLTHHLAWWLFVPYLGLNAFLGWLANNRLKLKQIPNDLVTGAGIATITFIV